MTEPQVAMLPDEGVRHYSLLCIAGLGVTALALLLRGLDSLALLPALAGILAIIFRWRSGALVVLLVVAWLLAALRWPCASLRFASLKSGQINSAVRAQAPR